MASTPKPPQPWLLIPMGAALLLLASPSGAYAGGWTQPEGGFYLKAWSRFIAGEDGFLDNGETSALEGSYSDISLNLYGEYGLAEGWTLVGFTTPLGFASGHHPEGVDLDDSSAYIGNSWVGVRRALIGEGRLRLAVEAHYGYAPAVGDEAVASGISDEGRPYVYTPTVEAQRLDGELQVGYSLPSNMWLVAHGGYRHLFSDVDLDPVVYGFGQYGWSGESLVLDVHANLVEPLGDVTVTNVAGTGQTRYLGIGVGASYWLTPHFGANIGAEGAAYAESNAATLSLAVGVELR
ncbi:MAG: hypothetical protein AAFS10_25215 [Myxococcota bacterium]